MCMFSAPLPLSSLHALLCHSRRETPLGAAFFSNVARPATVRNILCQAYADSKAVTDELVDVILQPGLQVHARPAASCSTTTSVAH